MHSRPTALSFVKSWANASSPAALLAQNAGVALGYFLLAELVLAPQVVAGLRAAPVWPANGFVLAAVWLLGPRVLPGVGVAAALVTLVLMVNMNLSSTAMRRVKVRPAPFE